MHMARFSPEQQEIRHTIKKLRLRRVKDVAVAGWSTFSEGLFAVSAVNSLIHFDGWKSILTAAADVVLIIGQEYWFRGSRRKVRAASEQIKLLKQDLSSRRDR